MGRRKQSGIPADAKRRDPEFSEKLRARARIDEAGVIHFENMYASHYLNFTFKGETISAPYSHVSWFLSRGEWPKHGMVIDHIDDDPMNNRPNNLAEITEEENQRKRRNRIVSPNYGKGKYGYGISVQLDERDGRFYVSRYLSRGHHKEELKTRKKMIGGYDTMEAAEVVVSELIAAIQKNGADYMPEVTKNEKRRSIELMAETRRIRELRNKGYTMQQIADETGFSLATIFNKTKGIASKKRKLGSDNPSSRYTESQVADFKRMRREGISVTKAGEATGIRKQTAYQIARGAIWTHVE